MTLSSDIFILNEYLKVVATACMNPPMLVHVPMVLWFVKVTDTESTFFPLFRSCYSLKAQILMPVPRLTVMSLRERMASRHMTMSFTPGQRVSPFLPST